MKPLLIPSCILVVSLILMLPVPSQAQYLEKQMESLRNNIGTADGAQGKSASTLSAAREELSALQQLESYVSNDDYSNAIRTVKRALTKTDNPANRKLWQSLLTDLEKQQSLYHESLKKRVDEKIAFAAQAALKAKKIEDLDSLIDDLNDFQNYELNRGSTPYLSRLRTRLSQAVNFVNRWQNYLEAAENETASRQIEILNDLINNRSSYRLIDKTQLTELRKNLISQQTKKIDSLSTTLKPRIIAARNGDDLQPVIDEVAELQNSLPYNTPGRRSLDRMMNSLNNWINVLQAESAGNSQQLLNTLNNYESNSYNQHPGLISRDLIEKKRIAALTMVSGDYEKKLLSIRPAVEAALNRALKENNPSPAVEVLDLLQNNYYSDNRLRNQLNQLRNDLERSSRMQQHLANNRATPFFNEAREALSEDNPWYSQSRALREPLLLKGLEKFFSLKLSLPKNTGLNTALSDAAKSSAAQGNWSETAKIYAVLNSLNPSCASGDWSAKMKATESYLQALRLKDAGEKELAITSARNVLYGDPEGLPRKETIALLKDLRTK